MKTPLIRIFSIVVLIGFLSGCTKFAQRGKEEEVHPDIYYVGNLDCWCVDDEDLKILLKEAGRY